MPNGWTDFQIVLSYCDSFKFFCSSLRFLFHNSFMNSIHLHSVLKPFSLIRVLQLYNRRCHKTKNYSLNLQYKALLILSVRLTFLSANFLTSLYGKMCAAFLKVSILIGRWKNVPNVEFVLPNHRQNRARRTIFCDWFDLREKLIPFSFFSLAELLLFITKTFSSAFKIEMNMCHAQNDFRSEQELSHVLWTKTYIFRSVFNGPFRCVRSRLQLFNTTYQHLDRMQIKFWSDTDLKLMNGNKKHHTAAQRKGWYRHKH